jgi:CheY-like chemotaxis protein
MARILLVDDEPLISVITEEWLLDLGHTVVGPALDLTSALKLAEGDVDAAVIDVTLGRETGYPLAAALDARGVPFVFATGYGKAGLEPDWRNRETLAKPFEFEAFRSAIEGMIGQS